MKVELPDALAGERLDRAVALLTGCSRADASALVADGLVLVDGRPSTKSSLRLESGSAVELLGVPGRAPGAVRADGDVAFNVVHRDDDVLVVDKPAGLVVHPGSGTTTGTLVHGLLALDPAIAEVGDPARPGIVHRLDKDTSGLLLVARTPAAHAALVRQLARREVSRRYLALVWGHLEQTRGIVDAPVGRSRRAPARMSVSSTGREARTAYEVADSFSTPTATSLLACTLETGRTHQIRVHLAAIGHPVVGDRRYGSHREPLLAAPRQALHAAHLAFDHPRSGARLAFDSALPGDLRALVDALA